MALPMNAHQSAVYEARQRIFNYLCSAFRRSRENPGFRLLLENVKTDLKIPQGTLTEALETFCDAAGQYIVIVLEHNGRRYLTLGESAKVNLSDWAHTLPPVGSHSTTPPINEAYKQGYRYAEAAIKSR